MAAKVQLRKQHKFKVLRTINLASHNLWTLEKQYGEQTTPPTRT